MNAIEEFCYFLLENAAPNSDLLMKHFVLFRGFVLCFVSWSSLKIDTKFSSQSECRISNSPLVE